MEQGHFARLQRYIVRFAEDEADIQATIAALSHIDWSKLLDTTAASPDTGKPAKKQKEPKARKEKKKAEQPSPERIAELRALPYAEYLKSPEWKKKRSIVLRMAGYRCQICNDSGLLNVHHRTYERLGCEWKADLLVLCQPCHETFHKNGKLAKAQ